MKTTDVTAEARNYVDKSKSIRWDGLVKNDTSSDHSKKKKLKWFEHFCEERRDNQCRVVLEITVEKNDCGT